MQHLYILAESIILRKQIFRMSHRLKLEIIACPE